MTKPELMKQLEAAVDDAIRTRMWGEIGITFQDGEPAILRQQKTTRLMKGGNGENHAATTYR